MNEPRVSSASTALRMVLGRRLQGLRERAGLTYEQAAGALDVTHVTVRRMERAEVGLKSLYVERLLRVYGVGGQEEIDEFLALVRQANRPGWWNSYRDVLPGWASAYVSLEYEAAAISGYEPHYVPGLLQTEEYARSVLSAALPGVPDADVDRHVAVRLERQALLTRPDAPAFRMALDETVFRRAVVPAPMLRRQVARLLEALDLPNVALQVVPFAAGAHPAMYGPFHHFRFRLDELPDVVCVESLTGMAFVEDLVEVAAYVDALKRLDAQADPAAAAAALRAIAGEI